MASRSWVRPAVALLALLGPAASAHAWDRPQGLGYVDGITYFNDAARASDLVTVEPIGTSVAGLPIAAVVVTRAARPEDAIRVLVICRQHGHEPGSERAACQVVDAWRHDADPKTVRRLRRVAFILIPYANPDGAVADRRGNAHGLDLNRDWQARTQPETQAVERAFLEWQPHLVLDCHVFDPQDPNGPWAGEARDLLEAYQRGDHVSDTARALQRALARRQNLTGWPVRESYSDRGFRLSLAHRHFAANHGAPSLLFECGRRQVEPFAALFRNTLAELGDDPGRWKPALDNLRGLRSWRAPERRNEPIALPLYLRPVRLRRAQEPAGSGDFRPPVTVPLAGIAGAAMVTYALVGLLRRRRS